MVDPRELARSFEEAYGRSPRLYRAPGRVNLIGEHTDYNDGLVMPMAIDRSTWVAAARRPDRTIVVRSREYGETCVIEPTEGSGVSVGGDAPRWSRYVRGIAIVLDRERGADTTSSQAEAAAPRRETSWSGADLLIASDVPIGAGLSSSAALEVACGYALTDLQNGEIDLTVLARAGQRAEHEFVGIRCGIMDQMVACHARAGHALWLDTRTLERRHVPLPGEVRIVICNTMVTHQLAMAEYNARRADCEEGVRVLGRRHSTIRALRDVTIEQLEDARCRGAMTEKVFRRCRHVVTENARVDEARQALSAGDFRRFGSLMNESHDSLRVDYEVSCAELDAMASIARLSEGVYGARMTGGGFGGCVVALADARAASRVENCVIDGYSAETGVRPDVWISSAAPGVCAA